MDPRASQIEVAIQDRVQRHVKWAPAAYGNILLVYKDEPYKQPIDAVLCVANDGFVSLNDALNALRMASLIGAKPFAVIERDGKIRFVPVPPARDLKVKEVNDQVSVEL